MNEKTEVKKKPKLKYKIPKQPGGAIDLLYKVRTERKRLASMAEREREQESMIEEKIFEMFKKSELEGGRGKTAQASIKRSDVPTFENDRTFFAYLKKTGDFDLLQRRLSVEACRERWAAKKQIPGVGIFTKVSLNLTKTN
jgi:hypothetical protein